jgi:hypothetical protein
MAYYNQGNFPTSEYQIIFNLDEVDEEILLNIENKIQSSGYAKLNPESNYTHKIRVWNLDWKNHGDNPQEIIAKLKKYNKEVYKKIRVEKIKD